MRDEMHRAAVRKTSGCALHECLLHHSWIVSNSPEPPSVPRARSRHVFGTSGCDIVTRRRRSPFQFYLPAYVSTMVQFPISPLSGAPDRKSTRLNSSHVKISYAVFCL